MSYPRVSSRWLCLANSIGQRCSVQCISGTGAEIEIPGFAPACCRRQYLTILAAALGSTVLRPGFYDTTLPGKWEGRVMSSFTPPSGTLSSSPSSAYRVAFLQMNVGGRLEYDTTGSEMVDLQSLAGSAELRGSGFDVSAVALALKSGVWPWGFVLNCVFKDGAEVVHGDFATSESREQTPIAMLDR